MKELSLQVTSYTRKSRKYNSYKGQVGTIAPNRLNRRFTSSVPYQKIVTDTTEFKYFENESRGNIITKKLYLNPFMDLYNSEILTYGVATTPNAESILIPMKKLLK